MRLRARDDSPDLRVATEVAIAIDKAEFAVVGYWSHQTPAACEARDQCPDLAPHTFGSGRSTFDGGF